MAMIRRQIYIPEDLYIKATARARLEGKNFSQVVRDGIKLSLDKNVYIDVKKRKGFENPFTKEKHNIGIIAVSGGHRTPEGKLEEFLNGGQTLGSSYTEIPEPNPNNFMNDLRKSLRDSTEGNMNSEPTIIEAIKSQLSIKISDRLKNLILG